MCEPLTESLLPKELNVKENSSLNLVFLPEIPDTDVVELGSALRRHQPRRPLLPMLHDEALSAVEHNKRARTTPTTVVNAATIVRLNRRPRRRRNDSSEDDDDRHPPLPFM